MRKSLFTLNIALILCISSRVFGIGGTMGPMDPVLNVPGQPGYSEPESSQSSELEYRQRDGQNPAVTAAIDDIKAKLSAVVKLVNEANVPSQQELGQIETALKASKKYEARMSKTERAYHYTLTAWQRYFRGDTKLARSAAMQAVQLDKNEANARITLIAMAIANDDHRSMKSALNTVKPQNGQSGEFNDPSQAQMPASQLGVTLDFNADSIMTDILGAKVGLGNMKCINGATFNTASGQTIFMLVWNLASVGAGGQQIDQSSSYMSYPSGQTAGPIESFGKVFRNYCGNSNFGFIGVNTDEAESYDKVLSVLMSNPWPWANLMAKDGANTNLAALAKKKISSPMLLVANSEGTVTYAGSPSGIIAGMLATRVAGAENSGKTQVAQPTEAAPQVEPSEPEANATPTQQADQATEQTQAPSQVTAEPQSTTEQEPQPRAQKSEEETFNPQASNLLQFALSQKKTAKYTGYGNLVKACRQILTEYPETAEAEQARQLLREIPEPKRRQFHITDEELGQ